jgi:opacity protein-like surface antigen
MNDMRLSRVAMVLFALAAPSFAQVAEFSFSGGVNNISGSDVGSGYSLEGGTRFGFRVTLNNWKYFGHEFGYAYNRMHLKLGGVDQGGMAGHTGLYHFLVYALPEGSRVRPFAAGGVHFTNYVPPGASAQYGQGFTKFGVNYGGGIKFRVTTNWMIRADVHQYLQGKPFDLPGVSGKLKQNEITVGFAFAL